MGTTAAAAAAPEKESVMRSLMSKYGWPFMAVYASLSLLIFIAIYSLLLYGVDMTPLLSRVGIASPAAKTTSLVVLAVAFTKLLVPVKLPVAGGITYVLFRRRREKVVEVKSTGETDSLLEDNDDDLEYGKDPGPPDDDDDDEDDGVLVDRDPIPYPIPSNDRL